MYSCIYIYVFLYVSMCNAFSLLPPNNPKQQAYVLRIHLHVFMYIHVYETHKHTHTHTTLPLPHPHARTRAPVTTSRTGRSSPRGWCRPIWQKFSKVSSTVNSHRRFSSDLTFEKLYLKALKIRHFLDFLRNVFDLVCGCTCESCQMYEWVMSHVWTSHSESWPIRFFCEIYSDSSVDVWLIECVPPA